MNKYKTRFTSLSYCLAAPNHWRIIDNSTGGAIGPIYSSRPELLADLDRFARERGYDSDMSKLESESLCHLIIADYSIPDEQLKDALYAIRARINGVYDHPALLKYGSLSTNTNKDVLRIIHEVLPF